MNIPTDLKYTSDHEWVRKEASGTVAVGLTDYAQRQLGQIVHVEPPKVGQHYDAEDECGTIESVKAASVIFAPLAGVVVAVNDAAVDDPEEINDTPYEAWLFRLRPDRAGDVSTLLSADAYQPLCTE